MKLQRALRSIEDSRDAAEMDGDTTLKNELGEVLSIVRDYADTSASEGMPAYVGFAWGSKTEKIAWHTKAHVRRYKAQTELNKVMKEKGHPNGVVCSCIEEMETMLQKYLDSTLRLSAENYLAYCGKQKTSPFRWVKW